MKKKLKLKKGVKLGIFMILCIYVLTCLFLYIKIDLETKREIQAIKNSYKAHTSEIMFDETKCTQEEQTFVYEPKNDVKLIAEEIGIEYELFEAIIRHETGHRTSRAFKKLNNPCGMMFWNGSKMALRQYATIEDGYYACARNLKNNYIDKGLTTIEQIQKKYAPVGINDKGNVNKYWVDGVTSIYNKLKNNE
jgi:hypothetical protein